MDDGSDTGTVRRAGPDDAAELTRLRAIMFADMGRDPALLTEDWQRRNVAHFGHRLAETDLFAAYVVDQPGGDGLAACAVGWLNEHLIGTNNPVGRSGYVANICTDPAYRRRGYSRASLTALVDWLRSTGIRVVETTVVGRLIIRPFTGSTSVLGPSSSAICR